MQMENQTPIPLNPISGSQTPTPPPPVVQNEPKKRFPIPKYAFLGIVFIVLLAIIGGAYLLGKNSSNKLAYQTPLDLPEPTTQAATPTPDPKADWKTYVNSKYSIKYPSS